MLTRKALYLLPMVLLSGLLLAGCSSSKFHVDNNDNNTGEQEDDSGNDEGYGHFTFTARGETVTCTPSENQAAFVHDFHGSNYLTIDGINRELPTNSIYSIKLELLIQGELKPGAYQIKDIKTFADCLTNESGCDGVGQGGVIANKLKVLPNGQENTDMTADKKALLSTAGTLKITAVTVGEYVNGFAKGKISGTFSFSGTNLLKLTGTAQGTFEDVPMVCTE